MSTNGFCYIKVLEANSNGSYERVLYETDNITDAYRAMAYYCVKHHNATYQQMKDILSKKEWLFTNKETKQEVWVYD